MVELVAVMMPPNMAQFVNAKLAVDWISYIWFVIALQVNVNELPDCFAV